MIKEGKIKEAQAAAKVDLDGYSDVNSYSGYLTVGLDGCGSNLFFWFFPAMVGEQYFGVMYILVLSTKNYSSTQNPINSFLFASTIPTLVRFCCGFKEGLEDHLCLDCLMSMDHLK